MKANFIIFLSIVLTIYGTGSFYVFYHGLQAISGYQWIRPIYIVLFIFFTLSYIIARFIQSYNHSALSDFFLIVGSFWLAALLYFFLICAGVDLIRGINHFTNIYTSFVTFNYEKSKLIVLAFSITLVSSLLIYGYINAKNPVLNTVNLKFSKENSKGAIINAVMVSDVHLGTLSCGKWFDDVVERINALNPDVILLAGDVIDEDLKPVIERNLGEHLLNLKARYGVYAITGNHEYIGGVEPAVKYLTEHKVNVLRDTSVLINNQFYLIGREDREIDRFSGMKRKALSELIQGIDKRYPTILMNHQPTNLDEIVDKGIDLSISGHTHHGQFFPNNLITNMIYEVSRGLINKSGTWVYVSTGLGTWGPPIRIGNKPEIVNFRIEN